MRGRGLISSVLFAAFASIAPRAQQPADRVPSPETHFGFRMGADGYLASADAVERYFELVAAGSDRVKVTDLGATTGNHRTVAAIVSAPENIRNLDQLKRDNQRLADPRTLSRDEAARIWAGHKAVVVIGCSIHATEVGGTQAANQLLYELATSNDRAILDQLRNVVLIVIPMLNPDGNRQVVDWFNRFRSTPFDGGPMPASDHKYAGHDINRDGFMLNLAESRNLSRFFNTEWHPQVFLSMHQMENDGGPRFYAPPNSDPIGSNYDPVIWREAALLGASIALELERDQRAGVASNSPFDYYWPGYEDSVPLGHNTVCLLTEAASARVASTVTETRADPPAQIDLPHPWPGGPWRLRDIVEYDLSAMHGLLRGAAAYRGELVRNFYDMGRRAVDAGVQDPPFAFVLPVEQHDALATRKLEELLLLGGVEIQRSQEPFRIGNAAYGAGSDLILLSQPYRAYVKTLLERQDYPARPSRRPYDATGWTLPAQMGVDVRTIERPFDLPLMSRLVTATATPAPSSAPANGRIWGDKKPGYYLVEGRGTAAALARNRLLAAGVSVSPLPNALDVNGYRYPAGSLVVPAAKDAEAVLAAIAQQLDLRVDGARGKPPVQPAAAPAGGGRPRLAIYKPAGDNSDEGWTRWLLERYEFPFRSADSALVRSGNLRAQFDAIILPGVAADLLIHGLAKDTMPPGYGVGLGEEGLREIDAFVKAGGTLICLDQAGAFAIDLFKLPIKDLARLPPETFYGPGALVRIELDPAHPLARGVPAHAAAFFSDGSAYDVPRDPSVTTIARYAAKDVLVSGMLHGEPVIAGRPAAVSVTVGAGHVVLFGFSVQHRAQTYATFPLLFNAIFASR